MKEHRCLSNEIAMLMKDARVHKAGGRLKEQQVVLDRAKRLHIRRSELCK